MATSPHFSEKELRCHHCLVNEVKPELLDALERLRSLISKHQGHDTPIHVNSAYRCQQYDMVLQAKAPRKIENSVHVQGIAADIQVTGMKASELMAFVLQIPELKGLGRDDYKNYVHVDVRPSPARWCYDSTGAWMTWYPVVNA